MTRKTDHTLILAWRLRTGRLDHTLILALLGKQRSHPCGRQTKARTRPIEVTYYSFKGIGQGPKGGSLQIVPHLIKIHKFIKTWYFYRPKHPCTNSNDFQLKRVNVMQTISMHYNALSHSAGQCRAAQCSTVQFTSVQYSAEQLSAAQCSTPQCIELQGSWVLHNAIHLSAL